MASRGPNGDLDIRRPFLRSTGFSEDCSPGFFETRSFIDDDGKAIIAVPGVDER